MTNLNRVFNVLPFRAISIVLSIQSKREEHVVQKTVAADGRLHPHLYSVFRIVYKNFLMRRNMNSIG